MNRQEFDIILGPGLSDRISLVGGLIPSRLFYKDALFNIHLHAAPWTKGADHLDPKLDGLVHKIKTFAKEDKIVAIVGISGSASLALNAFSECKEEVSKLVTVCGRLNTGLGEFPSLALSAKNNYAFYESVVLAEENSNSFTAEDRSKIMTISSIYDELVPAGTSALEGAKNIRIPVPEHVLAIAAALTVYRKRWLDFILE